MRQLRIIESHTPRELLVVLHIRESKADFLQTAIRPINNPTDLTEAVDWLLGDIGQAEPKLQDWEVMSDNPLKTRFYQQYYVVQRIGDHITCTNTEKGVRDVIQKSDVSAIVDEVLSRDDRYAYKAEA